MIWLARHTCITPTVYNAMTFGDYEASLVELERQLKDEAEKSKSENTKVSKDTTSKSIGQQIKGMTGRIGNMFK